MDERLLRKRVKNLIGHDISKGWPDELSFLQITKLYSDGKDKEKIDIFTEGLEEATFNKEIEARKLAHLRYHCQSAGEWKKHQLETQEIEKVECAYKLKEKHKIFNENYLIFRLLNSAEVRLNLKPFDIYKPIALYSENYITLDWFYSAQVLNLWLEAVGELPNELLSAWFKSKDVCLKIVEREASKPSKKLCVDEFVPGFPQKKPNTIALVILHVINVFMAEHNFRPLPDQVWNILFNNPPEGVVVKPMAKDEKGGWHLLGSLPEHKRIEVGIEIEGKRIRYKPFCRRFLKYTRTKMNQKGKLR